MDSVGGSGCPLALGPRPFLARALLFAAFVSVAKLCNLKPSNVTLALGDCHIYESHIEAVNKQLKSCAEVERLIKRVPSLKENL